MMTQGLVGDAFDSLLEGAAALFIIYWLLASISSFVVELFSSALNTRGHALRQFAIDMVQGELQGKTAGIFSGAGAFANRLTKRIDLASAHVSGFAASLFTHNLMKSLEQPKLFRSGPNTAPAYVPSQIFAHTVLDRLLNTTSFRHFVTIQPVIDLAAANGVSASMVEHLRRASLALADAVDVAATKVMIRPGMMALDVLEAAVSAAGSEPAATDFIQAVDDALGAASPLHKTASAQRSGILFEQFFADATGTLVNTPAHRSPTVASVVEALDRADVPGTLRQAMRPLVDAANHDFDALSNGIAVWYDASMQRATGWYKRYSLYVLALVGFALAVAANVDTPRIIGALIASPELRRAGYDAASQVVATGAEARQTLPQQIGFLRALDAACPKLEKGTVSSCDGAALTRLLPFTLTRGTGSEVLLYVASNHRTGDAERFAREMRAFCAVQDRCSPSDSSAVLTKQAVIDDPLIFWTPDLANCQYRDTKPCKDPVSALAAARADAEAATSAVAAYSTAIPGVGWIGDVARAEHWRVSWADIPAMAWRLLGWLATALMVSFGAPFWFDLLQQVVNRRGAGPKPAEAQPAAA